MDDVEYSCPEVKYFTANLVTVRKALSLSQAELARRCGYTPQNLCDLESGRRPGLTVLTCATIAKALDVPLSLMFSKREKALREFAKHRRRRKKHEFAR
jgi:transcriptional regulator with XRE-family HTH domain